MTPYQMLFPLTMMALLSAFVLLFLPIFRLRDSLSRRARPSDFELGDNENVPHITRRINRSYMNMFESPVLFYVISFIAMMTDRVDALSLHLAWAYVGIRVVHALVHIVVNNVRLRLVVFGASFVALISLWVHVLVPVFQKLGAPIF